MSMIIEIGRHRLLCGDLTTGAVDDLMGEEQADVVYCDPPWGPGALQMFSTMSDPVSTPRLQWPRFVDVLCAEIAHYRAPHAPVFIEMGLRWIDDLDASMENAGLPMIRRWDVTYGSRTCPRRSTVALYAIRGNGLHMLHMPDPPHGESVTQAILEAAVYPGLIVFDPCCGLGMTARIAHRLGGSFRGVELVSGRLDRTAEWLRRHP